MGRRERLKNCCQRSWAAFVRPPLAGNAADEKQAAEAGAALRATEERASRAELIYQEEERVPYVAAATSLTPKSPTTTGDCGEPKWSCQKQPAFCRLCGACRFSRHSGLFPLLNDFQKSHLAPPCTMLRAFVAGKGQCLLIRVVCAGQPRLPRLALTPCPVEGVPAEQKEVVTAKGAPAGLEEPLEGRSRLHFGCLRF